MSNPVKRGLIEPQNKDISISRQCELIGINRSDYYYEPQGESAENLAIMAAMDKLHTDYPTYGVKRMVVNLPEQFQPTNHKKIRRLMRLMDIEALYQKPNLSKKGKESVIYPYLLRKVPIEHPLHVCSMDITYIPMKNGFMYLCAVVDWFSRFAPTWRLSNTLSTQFCIDAAEEFFDKYGCPRIFNTDQGSQFTSHEFINCLKKRDIRISMDGKGRALDNVFIERLWRTIKYEHIYLYAYDNGIDLYKGLSQYFDYYNYQRKHQSLNYLTPNQVFDTLFK